jgi:glucokinase
MYGDSHLFSLAADLLGPGDVVIAISNSGKLPELLEAVDTARAAGADVIAITSSQSPLAKRRPCAWRSITARTARPSCR